MADERLNMVCETCGSELVTRDAWAEWDKEAQEWVLAAVYDYAFCHMCQGETRIQQVPL
jgi:hypothetical protein